MKENMLIGLLVIVLLSILLSKSRKCSRESLEATASTLERKIVAHFQQYGNPSYASYIELLNNNNNVSTNLVRLSTFEYFSQLGKDLTLEHVIRNT